MSKKLNATVSFFSLFYRFVLARATQHTEVFQRWWRSTRNRWNCVCVHFVFIIAYDQFHSLAWSVTNSIVSKWNWIQRSTRREEPGHNEEQNDLSHNQQSIAECALRNIYIFSLAFFDSVISNQRDWFVICRLFWCSSFRFGFALNSAVLY